MCCSVRAGARLGGQATAVDWPWTESVATGVTFRVLQSNHIETLAEALARARLQPARASILQNDVVVVPNPGLGLWLRQFLAERDGVATALDMPLPGTFVWRVLRWLDADLPVESPYRKEVLLWRAYVWLGQHPPAVFADYLAPDQASGELPEQRRFDVARQVADVFDRYLVYRPRLLAGWEAGVLQDEHSASERWQAALWRDIVAAAGSPHPAAHMLAALRRLDVAPGSTGIDWPPSQVAVFGVASLPPLMLQFLAALGRHIDVTLHVLNPSREYWSDVVAERVFRRARVDAGATGAADYYETGNPLLGSMGRLGREFVDMAIELATDSGDGELLEAFREPTGRSVLAHVQREMLDLTVRGRRERLSAERLAEGSGRFLLDPDDASIRVHACASIVREVEVLHDQLLAAFEADPQLTPRDVIVMVPDIATTGPVVEAVFGSRGGEHFIPYAIADRAPRIEAGVADTFHALLALPDSRLTRTSVMSLVAAPPIARRLGLDADALALIGQWLDDAHVYWGLDAQHWLAEGVQPQQPPYAGQGTWAFGIDRMMVSYALESEQPFLDLVGIDGVDGQAGETAGVLAEFVRRLAGIGRMLQQPVSAGQWSARLTTMVLELMDGDGADAVAIKLLCDLIGTLATDADLAALDEPLPLAVVRTWFERELDDSFTGQGFPSGAVTVATLTPMRAIPFKVVALLGMNDADFPRQDRPVSFDVMITDVRKGDRSRRNEDRYLFIEALLSARTRLHVSYTGIEQRDATPKVPSVVVDELLDYLAASCVLPGDEVRPVHEAMRALRDHLVVRHPLQPFSACYGGDGDARLFTYHDLRPCERPSVPAAVPADPRDEQGLRLQDVVLFMRAPARAWFEAALRTNLYVNAAHWEDDERFAVDALDLWRLRAAALEELGQVDPDSWQQAVSLSGGLPHGVRGQAAVEGVREQMLRMRARIDALAGGAIETRAVEIHLQDRGVLVGNIDAIGPNGRVVGCAGRVSATDLARLWTLHLALAAADMPMPSMLVEDDASWQVAPVVPAVARKHLSEIAGHVRANRANPLPLLCHAGVWSVVQFPRFKSVEQACRKDFEDEHVRRIWGRPEDMECHPDLIDAVYGPMADYMERRE